MTSPVTRLRRTLNQFHAEHPWDHNAHYHRWLLRQLPDQVDRALDVGSGSGDLARLLSARSAHVHGIDADAATVTLARELTPPSARLTFSVGDALNDIPPGSYDVITCVATLHHLPLSDALAAFRARLTPGGVLVVVGLAQAQTFGDHLLTAAALPSNVAMAWIKNRGRKAERPASMNAPTRPADMTFAEIVRATREVLPGARLRRRLFWRYTLVWQHP